MTAWLRPKDARMHANTGGPLLPTLNPAWERVCNAQQTTAIKVLGLTRLPTPNTAPSRLSNALPPRAHMERRGNASVVLAAAWGLCAHVTQPLGQQLRHRANTYRQESRPAAVDARCSNRITARDLIPPCGRANSPARMRFTFFSKSSTRWPCAETLLESGRPQTQ